MSNLKKATLIVLIYISGCVCSYKYGKADMIEFNNNHNFKPEYTIRDRNLVIAISSTSWLGVASIFLSRVTIFEENNEAAKW